MMENKYWALEPRDSFLDVNLDDINEMREQAGLEPEPDPMTVAKAHKEQQIIDKIEKGDNKDVHNNK